MGGLYYNPSFPHGDSLKPADAVPPANAAARLSKPGS